MAFPVTTDDVITRAREPQIDLDPPPRLLAWFGGRRCTMAAKRSASDPRVTIYEPASKSPSTPRSPSTTRSSARIATSDHVDYHDGDGHASSSDLSDIDEPKPKRKRVRRATRPRPTREDPHPPPPEWQKAYDMIRIQRADIVAPVDTMGCDNAGAHDPQAIAHLPPLTDREQRFSVLVSLMLSSQTKDEVTAQAMQNLRLGLTGGFSVETVANAPDEELRKCINKVGFWRKKAEYVKQAAVDLIERHGGDVPKTLGASLPVPRHGPRADSRERAEELIALKGVGPKMALLCLSSAWDINVGIAVDTHVHRISNRLGWHRPATEKAEDTRSNLESWLPKQSVPFSPVPCL